MASGLPDFWRKYYFVGQDTGIWDILSWAAYAGNFRGIFVGTSINALETKNVLLFTVPSGKTRFITVMSFGAKKGNAEFHVVLYNPSIGEFYGGITFKGGGWMIFPVPVPISSGHSLYAQITELSNQSYDINGSVICFDV